MRPIDADKFKEWITGAEFCADCPRKGMVGCANCEINWEYIVLDWIDKQPTIETEKEN